LLPMNPAPPVTRIMGELQAIARVRIAGDIVTTHRARPRRRPSSEVVRPATRGVQR
jgi:hypothetical protein